MNMATDKFAVLILTHGRADHVVTYETLRRQGYTGDIYLVVDNEDSMLPDYQERFGKQVVMFDKGEIAKTFDTGDNFSGRGAVVFARNASFGIARALGLRYFLQLDDDYSSFVHKFTSSLTYREKPVKNLDRLFAIMLDYYKSIDAVTIAFAQNGDFIGGKHSGAAQKVAMKRKCMNTFFCSIDRPFQFVGRVNEDVNTYTTEGNRGSLLLTVFSAAIIQGSTQATAGGMTDLYLEEGTYRKSFYTVMYAPFCTTIGQIGYLHKRIHHRIQWRNAVPCIIDEEYRKPRD